MGRAVLYDGYCHSCSALVRFLQKRPADPPFELIPMQGERGRAMLAPVGIDPDDSSTFLVLDGDRAYTESDGVLQIARSLGPGWRALAAVGRRVPKPWRDGLYRLHARNRFRWFGRRETCYLPWPEKGDGPLSQ